MGVDVDPQEIRAVIGAGPSLASAMARVAPGNLLTCCSSDNPCCGQDPSTP
jgi:hypothetical protein